MALRRTDDQTTVGPLEPEVRDDLAEYRDERDLPSYNEAVKELLDGEDNA